MKFFFTGSFMLPQPNMCSGFIFVCILLPVHENQEESFILPLQFFKSTLSSGKFGNISLF